MIIRFSCTSIFFDDATPLLLILLHKDCKRSCVLHQLCTGPVTGRGGRQSTSERQVTVPVPPEIMIFQAEAPGELDVLGVHWQD